MTPGMLPDPPAMYLYFPIDTAVIDPRKEFGAKGDGKADDTEALQKALDASCGMDGKPTRVLFLRNGTYRLTKSLIVKSAIGPWLYGESRDNVVLKLDDGVSGVTSVLRTHPNEKGPTSADWFMRNVYNITVDVGKNPQTDGIRWHATNSGILKNVRVKGMGKVGINAGFLDQSGPNLIQDTIISGFETGILSQWIWGETLSRITISDCRKTGVYISANAVGIENLTVRSTPQALIVDRPNDWGHWSGVVALVGGSFSRGSSNQQAIENKGVLYAQGVNASGFQAPIATPEAPHAEGKRSGTDYVQEYLAPPRKFLGEGSTTPLPVRAEPRVGWSLDPKHWICVNDYGAVPGDNQDDTAAFEKAFAEAKKRGATTIYLRGVGGGDPNWYTLSKPISVPSPICRVMTLGFGRILGEGGGGLVVDDDSARAVQFLNIDSFGGPPIQLINRSKSNALVVESCGVRLIGEGNGPIFATNCPSRVELRVPGQSLWARQLNPEGDSDDGLVKNNGGKLWALGVKCEGKGIRFATKNGGRTEIYGAFMYSSHGTEDDKRPMFLVEGASMSVFGLREISFTNICFPVKIKTPEKVITSTDEGGWIGWSRYDIVAR